MKRSDIDQMLHDNTTFYHRTKNKGIDNNFNCKTLPNFNNINNIEQYENPDDLSNERNIIH